VGVRVLNKKYSNEELIEDIKQLGKEIGDTPTTADVKKPYHDIGTYLDRFGTWNNILRLAKLDKKLSVDEKRKNMIQEIAEASKLTRKVNPMKVKVDYTKLFDSWDELVEEVTKYYNKEENKLSPKESKDRFEYLFSHGSLTYKNITTELNISRHTVYAWLVMRRNISPKYYIKICKMYSVDSCFFNKEYDFEEYKKTQDR